MISSRFKTCTRCVMDETDPAITFDADGVCNHCHEAAAMIADMPKYPIYVPRNYKHNKYDVLIGLSGGVDSSYALHLLAEMGVRPLCFSIDNGWNTPGADENILRMVEALKVPFYRYTIDLEKFHDLQAAFLKSGTANLEIPTDHILMAATYEMAEKYGIKIIISGGNVATESIMPKAWGYEAKDLTFLKSVYRKATSKKLKGLPLLSLGSYLRLRFLKKIRIINLLDSYAYNREDAKKLLIETYGWKDYGEKHNENYFTQWFQMRYLPLKFGYDKRKAHFSSLIASKQMTRDEALAKLEERQVYPDIISFDFMKVPKKSYRDYPNAEIWWNALSKIYGTLKRF